MQWTRKLSLVLVVGGGFILFVSVLTLIAFPTLYKKELQRVWSLEKDSVLFNLWRDSPFPIYQRLYFFNVTNEKIFTTFGDPLEVEEVGPYTYRSKWVKKEMKWDNGTVTYREARYFFFDRENSVGTEEDVIHTLNGPLLISADYITKDRPYLAKLANYVYGHLGSEAVHKKTVGELGFGGYKESLVEYASMFHTNAPLRNKNFSWLHKQNGTVSEKLSVGTGEEDPQDRNVFKKVSGKPQLDYWGSKFCNMINGTAGDVGPPLSSNQTDYSFFQPVFCRSLTFKLTENRTVYGLNAMHFENTADLLADEYENPDNYCFETNITLPSGALDLKPCLNKTPLVLSFPHFYLGSSEYHEWTTGMSPKAEKHKSFIEVEPLTGMTLNMTLRYQLNINVESREPIEALEGVASGVYPILWVEIHTEVTDGFKKKLDEDMETPKKVAYSVIGTLVAVSAGMFIGGLVLMRLNTNRMYEEKRPLLDKDKEKRPLLDKGKEKRPLLYKDKDMIYETITPTSERIIGSGNFKNKAINTDVTHQRDILADRFLDRSVDVIVEILNKKSKKKFKTAEYCNVKTCTVPTHKKPEAKDR